MVNTYYTMENLREGGRRGKEEESRGSEGRDRERDRDSEIGRRGSCQQGAVRKGL